MRTTLIVFCPDGLSTGLLFVLDRERSNFVQKGQTERDPEGRYKVIWVSVLLRITRIHVQIHRTVLFFLEMLQVFLGAIFKMKHRNNFEHD